MAKAAIFDPDAEEIDGQDNPVATALIDQAKADLAKDVETKVRLRTITLKVDLKDYEAIVVASALRKSGLFRTRGELLMPEGYSNLDGAVIAEICRSWMETLAISTIKQIREGA